MRRTEPPTVHSKSNTWGRLYTGQSIHANPSDNERQCYKRLLNWLRQLETHSGGRGVEVFSCRRLLISAIFGTLICQMLSMCVRIYQIRSYPFRTSLHFPACLRCVQKKGATVFVILIQGNLKLLCFYDNLISLSTAMIQIVISSLALIFIRYLHEEFSHKHIFDVMKPACPTKYIT